MATTNSMNKALTDLGFSDLEAQVYLELLGCTSATGYRISHAIGKATANTYKALNSLQRRGAVIAEDAESRRYRAVSPGELISALEREEKARFRRAADALEDVGVAGGDDGVYRLQNAAQVLVRAQDMIAKATVIILLDAMPAAFAELRTGLKEAAARGVDVIAKVYRNEDRLPGVTCLSCSRADQVLNFWPGEQLNVVVDAEEHLLALLSEDLQLLHHGIWSQSVFLSCMHHNHIASELIFTWTEKTGRTGNDRLRRRLSVGRVGLPGTKQLFARCKRLEVAR